MCGDRGAGLGMGQEREIGARVPDQDAAEQPLELRIEQELLVDALGAVLEYERARLFGPLEVGEVVAEARDVDAEQLELRREVGTRESDLFSREAPRQDVGHFVA